jgi:hypothetical protein
VENSSSAYQMGEDKFVRELLTEVIQKAIT